MDETQPKAGQLPVPQPSPELEALFISRYAALRDSIYAEYPGCLFTDAERILESCASLVASHQGPPDSLLAKLEKHVKKEAQALSWYYTAITQNERIIRAAINRSLYTSSVDRAATPDDVFNEVLFLIYGKRHKLMKAGSAKLSTRLFSLAETHCYLYYSSKAKKRHEAVKKHLAHGGILEDCEVLSPDELADMRAAESEDWDAA